MKLNINTGAANSVLAKARSMYADSLTPLDYDAMASSRSISELAAYLKSTEAYADALDDITPSNARRGLIENRVRMRLNERFASICRYELAAGRDFYRLYIVREDIRQLLLVISLLNTGHPGDYLMAMPTFYNEQTQLDMFRLSGARTIDAVLEAIEKTPYYDAVASSCARFRESGSTVEVEAALGSFYRRLLAQSIERDFSGKGRRDIRQIAALQADTGFIINAYRLKKLFNASAQTVMSFYTQELSLLSPREASEIASADGASELLAGLSHGRYAALGLLGEYRNVESAAQTMLYSHAKKLLRFSTEPDAVLYSFVYLQETEINNIIHITEGVRYSIPKSDIMRSLIGA